MRVSHISLSTTSLVFLLACGGGDPGTSPGTGGPTTPVVTLISVSPALASIEQGTTTTLSAEIRDQFSALVSGKSATWSSSNPAVAPVIAATGVVTGLSVGTATITATVDGKSGSANVTVFPPPVKAVSLSGVPVGIVAGQAFTITAALTDRNGASLTGRSVTWSSSSVRVARVDASGRVTTSSGGSTTITAVSEGVSATVSLAVAAPAGTALASINSISPSTLTPGTTATVMGTNFGATLASNVVWVAGVPAVLTTASTTQIAFTVPTSGIPCQSTQSVSVELTTVAGTVGIKQQLAVATQRSLAVGASFMATAAGNVACNELPATGTYLVSVFNAGKNRIQTASFELTGSGGGIVAAKLGKQVRPTLAPARASAAPNPVDPAVAVAVSEHLRRLQEGEQLRRQLGPPNRFRSSRPNLSLVPGRPGLSKSQVPVPQTVGATASIRFNYNSCTTAGSPLIGARVVYVGPKAIVLEDTASALAGKVDADMVALAKDYETVSWPILLKFGDPLAYDDSLSRLGRIVMLFTPRVNKAASNLLGFVQPCDFYSPAADPRVNGSNQQEIFYARAVTDTSPTSTSLDGRSLWKRLMPGTLIHESKHIVANAERNATPIITNDEETWLEEATAQLASEMYGRVIHGNDWRTNASYFGTLDCEIRPTTPRCGGGVYVMGNHFAFLTDYLENIESKTILSGTDDNDIYGSSWMFTRWLVDTYGGADEGAFLHSIIRNFTQYGVDNVANAAGKTWPELLSQFSLMLAADDLPNASAPFVEASWSLPGVFLGYSTDISSRPPASPLALRSVTFGPFTTSAVTLNGGGTMLIQVGGAGSSPTQLFDLHEAGGGAIAPASAIGISILRIR